MNYELGDTLVDRVTDEEELELYDYEQLETLLYDVYQTAEVVLYLEQPKTGEEHEIVQAQHENIMGDIKSHDILLSSLHRAGQKVEEYLQTKPQRDNEPVNVADKLGGFLNRWSDRSSDNLEKIIPDAQSTLGQVVDRLNEAMIKLPEDTRVRRIEVNNIIKKVRECLKISPSIDSDEWKLIVDERAIQDAEIMINDLVLLSD